MRDELVNVWLYNPHDHDFVYGRSDGSFYAIEIRKGKDNSTVELPDYKPWKAPCYTEYYTPPLDKYGQANPKVPLGREVCAEED